MDNSLLKTATKLFKELNLSEICIKDEGCEIMMKRETAPVVSVAAPQRVQEVAPTAIKAEESKPESGEQAYSNCHEIKSPLVGVFYAASSPESAPYAKLGDTVKKGQVICIIEAMKMMNEICADSDGVVLDICAENGNVVEYGQTLFKLG